MATVKMALTPSGQSRAELETDARHCRGPHFLVCLNLAMRASVDALYRYQEDLKIQLLQAR